jgi:hypothetical protein
MKRSLRRSLAALALLAFPLVGCETKMVWLELPSFGSGAIDGIWLWRWTDATESYERVCRIDIGDPAMKDGAEAVGYIQDCENEHMGIELSAAVERSDTDASTVTVGLYYMRWEDPGTYKVSSFGDDGESALSETTLQL